MPTYDEVLTLGIEYGLIPFIGLLSLFVYTVISRHRKRQWVYADIQLRSGPSFRKQYPPKKGMILTKKYGGYVAAQQGQGGTFRGKPLFRYLEGNPYPIVYTMDRIPAEIETVTEDPKTHEKKKEKKTVYQEIVKSENLSPSAYRISAYERDRTHAQVYGGAARLEILLIVLVAIGVITLLAVVVK